MNFYFRNRPKGITPNSWSWSSSLRWCWSWTRDLDESYRQLIVVGLSPLGSNGMAHNPESIIMNFNFKRQAMKPANLFDSSWCWSRQARWHRLVAPIRRSGWALELERPIVNFRFYRVRSAWYCNRKTHFIGAIHGQPGSRSHRRVRIDRFGPPLNGE